MSRRIEALIHQPVSLAYGCSSFQQITKPCCVAWPSLAWAWRSVCTPLLPLHGLGTGPVDWLVSFTLSGHRHYKLWRLFFEKLLFQMLERCTEPIPAVKSVAARSLMFKSQYRPISVWEEMSMNNLADFSWHVSFSISLLGVSGRETELQHTECRWVHYWMVSPVFHQQIHRFVEGGFVLPWKTAHPLVLYG